MGRVQHRPCPLSGRGWGRSNSPVPSPNPPLHCPHNSAPNPSAGTQDMENRVPTAVFQPTASAPSSAHQLISTSPAITASLNYAALITQQNCITASCNEGEKLSRVGCWSFFFLLLQKNPIKTAIKESLVLALRSRQPSCGLGVRRGLVSRGLRDLQPVGKKRESLQLTETSPVPPPSRTAREPPRSPGSEVAYIARRVA